MHSDDTPLAPWKSVAILGGALLLAVVSFYAATATEHPHLWRSSDAWRVTLAECLGQPPGRAQ